MICLLLPLRRPKLGKFLSVVIYAPIAATKCGEQSCYPSLAYVAKSPNPLGRESRSLGFHPINAQARASLEASRENHGLVRTRIVSSCDRGADRIFSLCSGIDSKKLKKRFTGVKWGFSVLPPFLHVRDKGMGTLAFPGEPSP